MNDSGIGWTTKTHNPGLGCTAISEGCDFCYAEEASSELSKNPLYKNYADEFVVREVPSRLNDPKKFPEPELVFVGSMADLLHFEQQGPYKKSDGTVIPGGRIRPEYFAQILQVCRETPQHEYMFLTKRPHQFVKHGNMFELPTNVTFGVTVESNKWLTRIDWLRQIPAKYRFLSIEPLLEDLIKLEKYIQYIDYVIVGGESYGKPAENEEVQVQRHRRFMKPEWALRIRDLCAKHGKLFFFKQWGHVRGTKPKPLLPGISVDEYAELRTSPRYRHLRDDEMPWRFMAEPKTWQSRTYYEMPEPLLHIRKPWMF